MTNDSNNGFKTDAFEGALKKNEEMNNDEKVENDAHSAPAEKEDAGKGKGEFITDAFLEALKINEEMNKKVSSEEPDTGDNDTP